MILLSEFSVDRGDNALNLSHGEHASEERVTGILSTSLIAQHGHTMVDTHRQLSDYRVVGTLSLFLLEDTCQLNDVGTSAQMACLCEVAVREYIARAQMNEPCA